ncbi:hypothetical protein AB1N83_009270 [Pleurotus pulmonarius]
MWPLSWSRIFTHGCASPLGDTKHRCGLASLVRGPTSNKAEVSLNHVVFTRRLNTVLPVIITSSMCVWSDRSIIFPGVSQFTILVHSVSTY